MYQMNKIFGSVCNTNSFESSFSYKRSNLFISFEGIVYNKESLSKKFSLSLCLSDEEFLLEAFRKVKTDIFYKIDAVFSCVIYDKTDQKIYLARDKMGIKPLYFYHYQKTFIFGNRLRDFTKCKLFDKEIDKNSLSNYFTYGYILQPYTIYKNCYKVHSAHFALYDIKNNTLKQQKYWSLEDCYNEPKLKLDEEEITKEAQRLLQDSVLKRVQNSKNYGSFLSSGYDSSMICALLQENSSAKIKTFTIGFYEKDINEAEDAKKIANFIGTQHITHYFSKEDILKTVPAISQIYDEPFADYGAIPTVLLSKIAKEHNIDTLFGGDGGDEVFATADDIERFDMLLSIPYDIRKAVNILLDSLHFLSYEFPTKYYKLVNLLKSNDIPDMIKAKVPLFTQDKIKKILNDSDFEDSSFEKIRFGRQSEIVDRIIGTYFQTFLINGELIKTTQSLRYCQIEERFPFLDEKLFSFMAKVPSDIKVKNRDKKHVLKNIIYRYIPKEMMEREKKGFSIPLSKWLKGELNPLLLDVVNEENIKKDGILDYKNIIAIRDKFLDSKEKYAAELWSILIYQLWYEKNIRL